MTMKVKHVGTGEAATKSVFTQLYVLVLAKQQGLTHIMASASSLKTRKRGVSSPSVNRWGRITIAVKINDIGEK